MEQNEQNTKTHTKKETQASKIPFNEINYKNIDTYKYGNKEKLIKELLSY